MLICGNSGAGKTLTTAEGDKRYLKFPVAQGAETLQDIIVNGTASFNNTAEFNNTATFDSTIITRDTATNQTSDIFQVGSSTNIRVNNNGFLYLWTGGNITTTFQPTLTQMTKPLTMSGTLNTDRQITCCRYVLQDNTSPFATTGIIYSNANTFYYDNNVNSGDHTFATNNSSGVQTIPLTFSSANMTIATTNPPTCSASSSIASSDSSTKIPSTAWVQNLLATSGNKVETIFYTSTQTITPPANVVKMDIMVYGSGGAGGNGLDVGSYYVFGGSGAGGNMASASNISWNSSTTLSLVVNKGISGSFTELTFGGGLGVVRCYNGGNGGNGQTSGTGTAGAKNATTNSVPTALANWLNFYGANGQTGGSTSLPSPTQLVPENTSGQTIQGGGITNTSTLGGNIGGGQAWGSGGGYYSPSTWIGGGCMITWYKN